MGATNNAAHEEEFGVVLPLVITLPNRRRLTRPSTPPSSREGSEIGAAVQPSERPVWASEAGSEPLQGRGTPPSSLP